MSSDSSEVRYCDVFGNSGGNLSFAYNDPAHGPLGIGSLDSVNANSDSCDRYYNIFLDPLFADAGAGDFHLSDYSPCLGAADSTNPPPTDFEDGVRPDPPGRTADIGADEYWLASPVHHLVVTIVDGIAVLNWPSFGGASEEYTIYGSTNSSLPEVLLTTVWQTTTWTDSLTLSRPARYFYWVTAGSP